MLRNYNISCLSVQGLQPSKASDTTGVSLVIDVSPNYFQLQKKSKTKFNVSI